MPTGTAVFVLNIGDKGEVWSGIGSPKGQAGYMSQGPIAVSASPAYGLNQSMSIQQGYMPAQQVQQTTPEFALLYVCIAQDYLSSQQILPSQVKCLVMDVFLVYRVTRCMQTRLTKVARLHGTRMRSPHPLTVCYHRAEAPLCMAHQATLLATNSRTRPPTLLRPTARSAKKVPFLCSPFFIHVDCCQVASHVLRDAPALGRPQLCFHDMQQTIPVGKQLLHELLCCWYV